MYVSIIHLTHFNFKFVSQSAGHLSVLGGFIHVEPQPCLRNPISFGYLLGPLLGSIIFTDSRIIWVHSSPSYCERGLETKSVSHVNTFKKMLGSTPLLGVGKGRAADLRFIESVGRTIAQYANRSKIFGINTCINDVAWWPSGFPSLWVTSIGGIGMDRIGELAGHLP